MALDLPIFWASHLALISAGTSEEQGFECWIHLELPWARDLIKVSEPVSSSIEGNNNSHFTQLFKGLKR